MFLFNQFCLLLYSPPKNKFNLAMMQVEAGIREASQFYRGIPSTDAKSLMQKACNAKSYSIARFMFGHFIYDKVKGRYIFSLFFGIFRHLLNFDIF